MSKKSSKSTTSSKAHPFTKFVNFYLAPSDKSAVKEQQAIDGASNVFWIEEMVEDGYAFKFSYDARNKCNSMFMIASFTDSSNNGKIMAARHSSMERCIAILRYQHEVMSVEGVWEIEDDEEDPNNW